jgi:cob(I)alamin adenosyltransferase
LARIYTKTGDDGTSGLIGGSRARKSDTRFCAIGAVDEANSAIGLARAASPSEIASVLAPIQGDLFEIGAELADPKAKMRLTAEHHANLERAIDEFEKGLPQLRAFILPGGSEAAARLHLARTICRRAERAVVALAEGTQVSPHIFAYLNRLSDLLFVLARTANRLENVSDTEWTPGAE